jgi:hypothetical protein
MAEISRNSITAGVAVDISTNTTTKYSGLNLVDVEGDICTNVLAHRSTLNLDMRVIARPPFDPEMLLYDVLANKNVEFVNVGELTARSYFIETLAADRSNILMVGHLAYMHEIQFLALAQSKNIDTKWNFINDETLYIYENFVRDEYEVTRSQPYSALSYDDIGIGMSESEKFSLISTNASSVYKDMRQLQKLIDSLRDGGYLVLRNSNDSRRLYNSATASHSHRKMHKYLLSQDGYVYHSVQDGKTIFIKG